MHLLFLLLGVILKRQNSLLCSEPHETDANDWNSLMVLTVLIVGSKIIFRLIIMIHLLFHTRTFQICNLALNAIFYLFSDRMIQKTLIALLSAHSLLKNSVTHSILSLYVLSSFLMEAGELFSDGGLDSEQAEENKPIITMELLPTIIMQTLRILYQHPSNSFLLSLTMSMH